MTADTSALRAGDEVVTKADLRARYDQILTRGLSAAQLSHFRTHGAFGPDVVVQSTSGSTGEPLLIPRGRADIADIYAKVLRAYQHVYATAPARVALLGGISHSQAALKFAVGATTFQSFELHETEALVRYDPDFLSCYPSIVRVLLRADAPTFAKLKAVKLGGERVFPSDLRRIAARYPNTVTIEQFGSTELPALAMGVHVGGTPSGLVLQTDRFSFRLLHASSTWQPLVARDDFPHLLFPVRAFYDSGDEVRIEGGRIVDSRRRGDRANAYLADLDRLLALGCDNVQLVESARILHYDGDVALAPQVTLGSRTFATERGGLVRIPRSNKMPLVV